MKKNPNPKALRIEDFDYELPDALIAKYPAEQRDQSQLLLYDKGTLSKQKFQDIHRLLPSNSALVFNNTKVVPARLFFYTEAGKKIEIFCLSPSGDVEITQAADQKGRTTWNCMVGGAKKWKSDSLTLHTGEGQKIHVVKKGRNGAEFLIEFTWSPSHLTFFEVLESAGKVPLPPYMNRESEPEDKIRYQTVFAQVEGSVAAPTAALHFTPGVISALTKNNVAHHTLTLHVSAGTFRPVKSETMEAHDMHAEYFEIPANLIQALLQHPDHPIIPVGTTSMRSLESLYLIGEQILAGEIPENGLFQIDQWAGLNSAHPGKIPALQAIQQYMSDNHLSKITGSTRLMIAPGVQINMCNGLITNFHQPKSTLLLLVAALIGDDFKKAYKFAVDEKFRFLSYGDSCLFLPR